MFTSIAWAFLFSFVETSFLSQMCGMGPEKCDGSPKYRSNDGSCNNLNNPKWGSSGSEYGRLVEARFSDPNGGFPLSVSGEPLPNPRNMSMILYPYERVFDYNLSLNAMAYGQFIVHDMGFTFLGSSAVGCCTNTLQYLDDPPYKCAPVDIPADDPIYSTVGGRCMSMPRTQDNRDFNCSLENKHVEQLNQVTSYLDLHMVYGFTNESATHLRTFKGGMIKSPQRRGQRWILDSSDPVEDCPSTVDPEVCYDIVDPRINQNPHLTILHTIYLREHLRIAKELGEINPHWNDERIYQETRNIVISIHQHITYNEWLPVIFGREILLEKQIIYDGNIFVDDYDENLKSIVFNEFSHGASRFFHTMISQKLLFSPDGRNFSGSINITDWMDNPSVIEKGNNFDDLTRGLQCQHSMGVDQYHDIQITSQLFKNNFPLGLDLKSIDIQRGRDHGLGSYNDLREYCGLPRAKDFEDFLDVVNEFGLSKLMSIYTHVDDVELLPGGSEENFLPGILLGHTFSCIHFKQFLRTRISDRFFYQNGRSGFTLAQLKEIHKVTVSKLLCNNGKNITSFQPRGFYALSESNDLVPCNELPSLNITMWKEDPQSS